jgi:hypothetical protein
MPIVRRPAVRIDSQGFIIGTGTRPIKIDEIDNGDGTVTYRITTKPAADPTEHVTIHEVMRDVP